MLTTLILTLSVAGTSAPRVKWVPLRPQPADYDKQMVGNAEPTPESTGPVVTPKPDPIPSAAPSGTASSDAPGQLNLTCLGGGTANKLAVATVNSNAHVSGNVGIVPYSGSGYGSSTIMEQRQQGFADQVDVRLFNGDDRIRLPRTMLPPIHGGDGGWFRLKNVTADARSIRGKAAVNFMNSPNVFIDRVTGTISISGKAGDFVGQCQAVAANAPAQF